MRVEQGDAGYIRHRKIFLTTEAVLSFAIVIALVMTGYLRTHTRLNLLTLIAVLGCAPGMPDTGESDHADSASLHQ